MTPQAIQWPEISVSGRKFTLRFSFASQCQLTAWGKSSVPGTPNFATDLEWIASMCGSFDAAGKWHSEGFPRALDLADLMEPEDWAPIVEAMLTALKKAHPTLEVSAQQPVPKPSETPKSDSSISGPSELQAAA